MTEIISEKIKNMNKVYFKDINWNGDNIAILFEREIANYLYENNMGLKVVLRGKADIYDIEFNRNKLIEEKIIIVNVKSIFKLINIDYLMDGLNNNILDLYLSFGDKKLKLTANNYIVNNKQTRYFEPIFNVVDELAGIPYLTLKSELSILVGHRKKLWLSYCDIYDGFVKYEKLDIKEECVAVYFQDLNLDDYDEYDFYLETKDGKDKVLVEYFHSDTQSVDLNLLGIQLEQNISYQLVFEGKLDKNIVRLRVRQPHKETILYSKVVYSEENRKIILNKDNNELNFIAFDRNEHIILLDSKLEVNDVRIIDENVHIKLNDKILIEVEKLQKEGAIKDIYISLHCKEYEIRSDFNLNEKSELVVSLSNIDEISNNIESIKWNISLQVSLSDFKVEYFLQQEALNKNDYSNLKQIVSNWYAVKYINPEGYLQIITMNNSDIYNTLTQPIIKNTIEIKNLKVKENKLIFSILKGEEENKNNLEFLAINLTTNERYKINDVVINDSQIEIDFRNDLEYFSKKNSEWEIYSVVHRNSYIELNNLILNNGTIIPKYKKYFERLSYRIDYDIIPFLNDENKLGLSIDKEEAINQKRIPNKITKGKLNIKNISIQENKFNFTISDGFLSDRVPGKITFYLVNRKDKQKYYFENQKIQDDKYVELDFSTFANEFAEKYSRWNMFAEVIFDDCIEECRVGDYDTQLKGKYQKYFENLSVIDNFVVASYLTIKDEVSIVVKDIKFFYPEKYNIETFIQKIKLKGKYLTGRFTVSVPFKLNMEVNELVLKLRSKIEVEEHLIEFSSKKIGASTIQVDFWLNIEKTELKQFYYEIFLTLSINGEKVFKRLENASKKLQRKVNHSILSNRYLTDNHSIVYPYITPKNVFYLAYRQMDSNESSNDVINELIAYPLYKLAKPFLHKKNIWLVYEKNSETAQDNSYYFFKYCYENHHDKNIYYVIKRNAADRVNLKGMEDRVIYFMSIKHLIYMCAAKLLVASETRGHLYLWRHQKGKIKDILNKKKFVFLQHGVTAFKLNDNVLRRDSDSAVNLYVVTSDYERDIISNGLGYDPKEIIVTGFTRWDYLVDKSHQTTPKEIFLMPTWRGWLDEVPEDDFVNTPYFENYMAFLNSDKLHSLLERKNLKLNFFIHPKFKQYISKFSSESPYIRIISFGEEKVNELLMRTSLLITDYSSVAWEVYYLKKPVIFFQFDLDEYERLTGSYIDMNEGLFGDRVFNSDDLINTITDYVQQNFKEKDIYASQRERYFKYIDNHNSERVYNEIVSSKVLFEGESKRKKLRYEKIRKNKMVSYFWSKGNKYSRINKLAMKLKNYVRRRLLN
ncbi:CDP-glycerol glycerophosphotransferase family protein [Niallia sp. JL1B1071]|uniref:CDP-glycerol glycerophosphotransferase family protein n=1 Tax=Niallia tiangongensis TaxID=3237105 RepID=UPI0037DCD096